jgi:hypothetical protein
MYKLIHISLGQMLYYETKGAEDNIKMELREAVWEVGGWIHLVEAKDQSWELGNVVMNRHVP